MESGVKILNTILPIVDALRNHTPTSIITTVFLIFLFSFVGLQFMKFYQDCKNIRTNIASTKTVINKYSSQAISNNYEMFNQEISAVPVIGDLWSEYNKTLLKVQNQDGSEEVFSTIDAGYFLNDSNIIASRINLQFFNAIPGILTGLGILGTFIGLTIGIGQIQLGSDNVEVLKDGIKGLLGGVSTAFSTSLWGILLSIFFTWQLKEQQNKLQTSISELQESLDKLFPRRTPENLLKEMLDESRQQTDQLRKFNTDLAISIAAALDEALASRLTPALDKLLVSIETLTRVGTSQIAETITSRAGKEIADLGKVLSQVQNTLESTVYNSQSIQRSMGETMEQHVRTITENLDNFMNSVVKGQEEVDKRTQEKLQKTLNMVEESLTRQQERVEESTSRAGKELMSQTNSISQEISNMLTSLGQATNYNAETLRNQSFEMSEKIKGVIEEVVHRYQQERASINELLNQFSKALQQVESVIAGAAQAAVSFEKAAAPVNEAGSGLRNALLDLNTYQRSFANTVAKSQEQMMHYKDITEQTLEQIKDILEKTSTTWQAYENKFGVIKGELEAIFDELAKGLRAYNEQTGEGIKNYLQQLDTHFSNASSTLSGAIEELSGTVTILESTVDKIRNKAAIGR
ncbi:MAG: anti-phage ZorAB system protein ZorA [Bacillota bacterium]